LPWTPRASRRRRPAIRAASVLLLQNETPEEADIAAARIAREAGVTTILNAAPARALPAALADDVDLLVVNAIEAEMLGASPVGDIATALTAASALLHQARAVVVTAGGAGLAFASRDGQSLTLAAHDVRLRSTHGAGDAFRAPLRRAWPAATPSNRRCATPTPPPPAPVSTDDRTRQGAGQPRRCGCLGGASSSMASGSENVPPKGLDPLPGAPRRRG
jgi:ribokinase